LIADVTLQAMAWNCGPPWSTGFVQTPIDLNGAMLFSPTFFAQESPVVTLRLAHLHGSLRFGYTTRGDSMSSEANVELAEFDDIAHAAAVRQQIGPAAFGFGKSLINASPLISGLRKSEKLNAVPYGNYFADLARRVSQSTRLLLIGYGGADPHINFWLEQFMQFHTGAARFAEITISSNYRNTYTYKLAGSGASWNQPRRGLYEDQSQNSMIITTGFNDTLSAAVPAIRTFFIR
jgi:hypothetical protein